MLDSKSDCFNVLQNIIQTKHLNKKYRNVLETVNKIFTDGSETDTTDLQQIEMKLKNFSKVANVSSCYNQLAIKESLDQLADENKRLKSEIENMSVKYASEITSMKNIHSENLKELKETHKQEVSKLNSEINELNDSFKKREQELYNEIQVLQAALDMQSDDLETKYVQKVVDINNKLHEAQLVRSNLLSEINNLRAQLKLNDTKKDKKVIELQRKLQCTERELAETRNKLSLVYNGSFVGMNHGEISGNENVDNYSEQIDNNTSAKVFMNHRQTNPSTSLYKNNDFNYSVEENSLMNQKNKSYELKYHPLEISSNVNAENCVSRNEALNNTVLYKKTPVSDYTNINHSEELDNGIINKSCDNNVPIKANLGLSEKDPSTSCAENNSTMSLNRSKGFNYSLRENSLLNQTNKSSEPSTSKSLNVTVDNSAFSKSEGLHTNTLPYKKTPVTIYNKTNSKSKGTVKHLLDVTKNFECPSDKEIAPRPNRSKKRKLFNPNDLDYLENLNLV